ncbi:Cytochrome c family protein [hydrothermal vent metagenome]|uniref:Cytochrome c family protein n=1 Tax=hydrothermal vent metagenome TaxID=652676 RepID=A0A3B0X3C0_9ZZZZ
MNMPNITPQPDTAQAPAFYRLFFASLVILISMQSQWVTAASRGEALYLENCSICHGNEGKGGMGIPLSLASFLNSASDEYLEQSIRLGRPGRIMPSFYRMSEADISDIIQFISSWRKKTAPVWRNRTIKGDTRAGNVLFSRHCASCHGEEGRGGKGSGLRFSRPRDLPIAAPALNNQGFLNAVTDEMLHFIIKHGRSDTPMPSATDLALSDRNINDLVGYIRHFQLPIVHSKTRYQKEPASLIVDSPYSFEETVENVKRAIIGSNFVHIRDQSLNFGFNTQTSRDAKQTIIYFCNFSFLNEALKTDPRVGMFLPCRITVTENRGKVQMMSINPKHLSQLFNNNALDESCDRMYEIYTGILEDASL